MTLTTSPLSAKSRTINHLQVINDGNWAGATTAGSVDYANGGTPRASGVTETCTVNGLTENQSYYFAIQGVKSAPL